MRRTESTSIGDIIKEIIKNDVTLSRSIREGRVLNAWRDIVGNAIADATNKISITNGRLFVSFSSASARSEFFLRRNEIKKALNKIAESPVIEYIIVK